MFKQLSRRFGDYLVYFAVRLLLCLVQTLPIEMCAHLAKVVAWIAHDVAKFRQQLIDENLRGAFPDWNERKRRQVARAMWEHMFLMVCESAHARRVMHDTNWRRYINILDMRHITRYLIGGRPLVLVSGHFGNFELGGVSMGLLGFRTATVARPLDNPLLDRMVLRFRTTNGQRVLPKDGSGQAAQDLIDGGGKLMVLGDQHAGTKGCWVDFMGRPASCHKALALFSLAGNAPMLVIYARRMGKPLKFEVGCTGIADPEKLAGEMASVQRLTQWYNERLAEAIRLAPEQYWWLHRRWREKPRRVTRRSAHRAA